MGKERRRKKRGENRALEGLARNIKGLTEAINSKAMEDRERDQRREEEGQRTGLEAARHNKCNPCRRARDNKADQISKAEFTCVTREIEALRRAIEQRATSRYIRREFTQIKKEREQMWRAINYESRKLAKIQRDWKESTKQETERTSEAKEVKKGGKVQTSEIQMRTRGIATGKRGEG